MILDDFSVASVAITPQHGSGDVSACGYCSSMGGLTLVESYSYGTGENGERVTMTFDKESGNGVEQSLMFDAVVGSEGKVSLDNVFLFETSTAAAEGNKDGDPIFGSSKHVYFGALKGTEVAVNPETAEDTNVVLKAAGNNGKCGLEITLERDGHAFLETVSGLL